MNNCSGRTKSGFRTAVLVTVFYMLVVMLFSWVVWDDWQQTAVKTDGVNREALISDSAEGLVIEQELTIAMDCLDTLALDANVRAPDENSIVRMELLHGDEVLFEYAFPSTGMPRDGLMPVRIGLEGYRGEKVRLRITYDQGGLSFWYGSMMTAGKLDVKVQTGRLTVNGVELDGSLVMQQKGLNRLHGAEYILPVAVVLYGLMMGVWCYARRCRRIGRSFALLTFVDAVRRYSFLLKQLVARDFKVKYKASVLGVLWSFLNPMLMTIVYYIVFSTVFSSNIENFVVYLMSGIILFNYFSESTTLGMNAIVGNAGLITKVYIPKFIFPLSKALSSSINMVISLLPLLIVMLLTGVPFTKSLLLLPLVVFFLVVFSTGVSLMLSSMMVFFRDVQFLWSVLVTMWNFLTPIFYPESIIPAMYLKLYHLNPLYQIVYFMRSVVIGGISPTPITYLYCCLAAFVPLAIGIFVFRKTQDKFALYL